MCYKHTLLNILIFFISLGISGCMPDKNPAILFDGEKYKFGEVLEGEEIVFTFYFTNPGTGDLTITGLSVSCYCVVVKEYDRLVKPGGKGKIYGVVQTKGFQGDVVKAIQVETNIPQAKPVVITIEGKILVPAEASRL